MTHSDDFDGASPTILLPYQEWIESAYHAVALNALKYAAKNGLPGNHCFYLTFNTAYLGVSIPPHLKAKYPDTMTIVLQHQFWDLIIDEQEKKMSVSLSFGGIASTLVIPFGAFTAFSDPEANLLLTVSVLPPSTQNISDHSIEENIEDKNSAEPQLQKSEENIDTESSQVISLDAFRKKHD